MLDRLYMQILDMSLQASIVILVVMLARLLLKPAPKVFSYGLWFVVLLRLLCPVSIEAPVSVVPDFESVSENYTLADQPITALGAGAAAYRAVGDALNGGLGVQHIYTSQIEETGMPKIVTASWWEVWILFGQYVWLIGVAGLLIYSAVTYLKLRRKLIGATPMQDNIYLADHIDTPFVLGLLGPKIYLPSVLSGEEYRYIIAHEQQHIRRLDHLVKLIAYLTLAFHWFNPLVWVAYILLCKDMEMSCDEAVIRKLGDGIRGEYSASLLNLATGSRSITITPLAFGEGDTKGRIKNLSRWKKPLLWGIVAAAVVCVAVAVCLLTDPIGSGYDRTRKITSQTGYSIIDQSTKEITLSLSTKALPESIYSEEGCEFAENEIVVYNDDANKIYLKGARYSNEGTDNLYFYFEFSYKLPRDRGRLLYPLEISQDGYSYSPSVVDGILRTEQKNIENAVKFRGQDSDERIWFYISTDALKQIDGAFAFDIRINQITYLKDGAKQELLTDLISSKVGVSESVSAADESRLTVEVSLPKTDLSSPGKELLDKIAEEWNRYDKMSELERLTSSHLWGAIYVDADTWSECEKVIGVTVVNPLEQLDWIEKTGYIGMQSTDPTLPLTHIKATAYATQMTDRQLSRIDITAGYQYEDVRITLTATVCGQAGKFTTGTVRQGYATFDTKDTFSGSGDPVFVVTPDEENNTGYYNDDYFDQIAYWVDETVFYTLRVVGSAEDEAKIRSTLERLLQSV